MLLLFLPHLNPLQRGGLAYHFIKSPSPLERGWGEAINYAAKIAIILKRII
jgi:hypothetical protein